MKPKQYSPYFITFGSLLFLVPSLIGMTQPVSQNQSGCSYLEKDKPSIYISYDAVEETRQTLKRNEHVILRLHNNSTCTIVVETDGIEDKLEQNKLFKKEVVQYSDRIATRLIPDPPEGARLPIFYDIQGKRDRSPKP